jgi:hypothetical protein
MFKNIVFGVAVFLFAASPAIAQHGHGGHGHGHGGHGRNHGNHNGHNGLHGHHGDPRGIHGQNPYGCYGWWGNNCWNKCSWYWRNNAWFYGYTFGGVWYTVPCEEPCWYVMIDNSCYAVYCTEYEAINCCNYYLNRGYSAVVVHR